ncbi:hypothetical protein DPMN_125233 [Dreissena polymorpha]|uniref:Uncharacterized protein n=1 Tax=Dreissena polymorpha TaxID=45954 RepID=A0A9D4GU24_DREPO|nr:hypothetical protein DPMN_125233 [Dreissena polymorpha]
MSVGHTLFTPDWHFGIWKSKWRDFNAETFSDVAASVGLSLRTGHNIPQLVGDTNPIMLCSTIGRIIIRHCFNP